MPKTEILIFTSEPDFPARTLWFYLGPPSAQQISPFQAHFFTPKFIHSLDPSQGPSSIPVVPVQDLRDVIRWSQNSWELSCQSSLLTVCLCSKPFNTLLCLWNNAQTSRFYGKTKSTLTPFQPYLLSHPCISACSMSQLCWFPVPGASPASSHLPDFDTEYPFLLYLSS